MMEKRQPLNKCSCEKWLPIGKKLKLDPCLSPCTSINSKWIKDLNIRPKILKLVQEGEGNKHSGTNRYRKRLPHQKHGSPATKRKNGQMGLHKIKKLLHNKRNGV
jgi:hypothetical protein